MRLQIIHANQDQTRMMNKTYELVCQLHAPVALERIETLLSKEGVKYKVDNLSLASSRTPIIILGIQPKLYSHNNWVGLNPFIFISGITVRCESNDNGFTNIIIQINRLRALLWAAFWIWCSFLAARAMPEPAGILFFLIFSIVMWISIVSFFAAHLVKAEINDQLKGKF